MTEYVLFEKDISVRDIRTDALRSILENIDKQIDQLFMKRRIIMEELMARNKNED